MNQFPIWPIYIVYLYCVPSIAGMAFILIKDKSLWKHIAQKGVFTLPLMCLSTVFLGAIVGLPFFIMYLAERFGHKTQTIRFYKESGRWYAHLPAYNGPKADLEMVCGADELLDLMANEDVLVDVVISTKKISDGNKLVLIDKPAHGGANYLLHSYNNKYLNHQIWLCNVLYFVFDRVPKTIYFKVV